MYRNMVDQLYKNAPEIRTLYFSMNDAGSGTCWEDWLYSGPNGPAVCRNVNKSEAIVTLLNVYKEGAKKQGMMLIYTLRECLLMRRWMIWCRNSRITAIWPAEIIPPVKNISGLMGETYPVKGIINPLEIIRAMSRNVNGQNIYVFNFWSSYSRAQDRIETITKIVDIVEENLINPPGAGEINALNALKKLCGKWAGQEHSEQLFNALLSLDNSLNENQGALRGLSTLYWGVSTRQITRPLGICTRVADTSGGKIFSALRIQCVN